MFDLVVLSDSTCNTGYLLDGLFVVFAWFNCLLGGCCAMIVGSTWCFCLRFWADLVGLVWCCILRIVCWCCLPVLLIWDLVVIDLRV